MYMDAGKIFQVFSEKGVDICKHMCYTIPVISQAAGCSSGEEVVTVDFVIIAMYIIMITVIVLKRK